MDEATATRSVTGRTAVERPAAALCFSKMHGAGNDFVVLDLRNDAGLAARLSDPGDDLCRMLADRRTGIGCDQILGIEPARSEDAVASYRIWNADGSSARQCGNGARCVAAWLVRDGAASGRDFKLDSPAGTHVVECDEDGTYAVEMGAPVFAPPAVPMVGFDAEQDTYVLERQGHRIEFGVASMGNPHAVIVVEDVAAAPVGTIGPMLQRDKAFPESVNVGFVEVLARDRIQLRVHERGAGETLACGSGACAAVAVLSRQGRVDGDSGVDVCLPGGALRIHYDQVSGSMRMRGPATFVFVGELMT